MNHIPFNLERARAGDAIQTIEGRERRLIAYLPDRRPHLRVVVLDPKSDKLYSHSESGEHCESVASLKLVMKPIQEPAATKQSTISPEIREELLRIVREVFEPKKAVERWLVVWITNSLYGCGNVLYENYGDAVQRAALLPDACKARVIRIEL